MRRGLAALPALLAGLATAEPVPVEVPSGQPVSLMEILLDDAPGALWVRFRFLAPGIKPGDDAMADMEHLCAAVAVPYLSHHAMEPDRVVISLGDRFVEFGAKDPDATQFFEVFSLDGDACVWEGF